MGCWGSGAWDESGAEAATLPRPCRSRRLGWHYLQGSRHTHTHFELELIVILAHEEFIIDVVLIRDVHLISVKGTNCTFRDIYDGSHIHVSNMTLVRVGMSKDSVIGA